MSNAAFHINGTLPGDIQNLVNLTALDLSSNNLFSTVPSQLFELSSLIHLNLSINQLQGSLSASINNLVHLQSWDFHRNNFTGTLPALSASLSSLNSIDLSKSKLYGTIPESWYSLYALHNLSLANNSLSGALSNEIGQLTQLISLDLSFNIFHGNLPAAFGTGLQQVQYLYLDNNGFSGQLSEYFSQMQSLLTLSLSYNAFSGSLSQSFSNLSSLEILNLQSNSLVGSLLSDFPASLRVLNVGDNQLIGTITSSLGHNLSSLTTLIVMDNQFSGTIPVSLGQLSALQTLQLSRNRLTGTLPTEIGNCTELRLLATDSNALHGSLPESLGNLAYLETLKLGDNYFNGSFPQSLFNLSCLTYVNLTDNAFTGALPDLFDHWMNVTAVYLSMNALSGSLPLTMGNLTQLQFLHLDNNQFTGYIPPSFRQLSRLQQLFLHHNLLTGVLPSNLSLSLSRLVEFSVGYNHLTGTVESGWASVPILSFSSNQFTGTIPGALLQAPVIAIDLSANRFSGDYSQTLSHALPASLILLNDNYLSGSILANVFPCPSPSLAQRSLVSLNLTANLFTGTLSSALGMYTSAETISIANNVFSGSLGTTFSTMRSLTTLRINDNVLTGPIVSNALNTTESDAVVFHFHGNAFTGSLPDQLFATGKFESIIASINCFTTTIPASLCANDKLEELLLDGLHSASQCRYRAFNFIQNAGYVSLRKHVTGTIPSCLFYMPKLTALHLAGNGFRGKLQLNCQTENEDDEDDDCSSSSSSSPLSSSLINLDLSHNSLSGTVPEVIWEHNFTQLLLAFNRFAGIIPASVASYSAPDQSLRLEVNRFSGFVPTVLHHAYDINLLEGNLFNCDAHYPLPVNDPHYENYECGAENTAQLLEAVSGLIVVITLLGLWLIQQRQFPYFSKQVRVFSRWREVARSYDSSRQFAVPMHHIYAYGTVVVQVVRYLGMFSGVMIVIGIPLYSVLSTHFGMYTDEYVWTISLAYESGVTPAIAGLIFLLLLLAACLYVVRKQWILNHQSEILHNELSIESAHTNPLHQLPAFTDTTESFAVPRASTPDDVEAGINRRSSFITVAKQMSPWTARALLLSANTMLVLIVNGWYVYAADQDLSGAQLFFITLLISVFKLAWSHLVVNELLTAEDNPDDFSILQVLVPIFNTILAPFIAEAVVSPNCFETVFSAPPPVVSVTPSAPCFLIARPTTGQVDDITLGSITFTPESSAGVVNILTCQSASVLHAKNLTILAEYASSTSISFYPTFRYNFTCTSTLASVFVFVFLLRYLISGFVLPVTQFILKVLQQECAIWYGSDSLWTQLITNCLPMLWRPLDAMYLGQTLDEQERIRYVNRRIFPKIIASLARTAATLRLRLVTDVAVLLTFGVLFPPLIVIILMTILVELLVTQAMIGRILCILPHLQSADHSAHKDMHMTETSSSTTELQDDEGQARPTPGTLVRSASRQLSVDASVEVERQSLHNILRLINRSFKHFGKKFWRDVGVAVVVASALWGMMLFDILGDAVDGRDALWILFVMLTAPAWQSALFYLGHKALSRWYPWFLRWRQDKNELGVRNDANSDGKDNGNADNGSTAVPPSTPVVAQVEMNMLSKERKERKQHVHMHTSSTLSPIVGSSVEEEGEAEAAQHSTSQTTEDILV